MNEIIYIEEVSRLLDLKDIRSITKWCRKRGVEIFSEEGSNKKYIIRMQFEHARLKKFIEYLKNKFKDKWLDAFQAYKSANIIRVIEIEETENIKSRLKTESYKPVGEHEKQFADLLKTIF